MNKNKKSAAKKTPLWKKILFSLVSTILFFGLLEVVLRISGFAYAPRERIAYKPWVAMKFGTVIEHYPTEFAPPGYIWLMPKNLINPDDFKTKAFCWPTAKTPGKKLIAFMGGSTTQPDGMRSYPERCVSLLNRAAGTNVYETLNCGMSSYTTHQSLIALERYILPRNPDCVVVFHGWNDLAPHQNGNNDRQVDTLFRANEALGGKLESLVWVKDSKTAEMLGFLLDKMDQSWPRPRINERELEENYSEMAELCAEKNIPLVIVERPTTLHPQPIERPYFDLTQLHYKDTFGTNAPEIHKGIHMICTSVQARVASAYPNAILSPVCEDLWNVQQALEDHPHDGLLVYNPDYMHVRAFGNQYIAETIAKSVAPELSDTISAITNSGAYWTDLAEGFKTMDAPYQCSYAVSQADRFPDADKEKLSSLQTWATNQYHFMEIFEHCRWDNSLDVPLEERLAGLDQCIQMRPSDFGVAQQTFRVSQYLGDPGQAFPYLIKFKPKNANDQYRWLKILLPSALQAQKWGEAKQVAETLIKMNPNDQEARNIYDQLVANGVR